MNVEQMQAIADGYQARFPNWEDIAHPSIITLPRFLDMVRHATAPINRVQIDAEFGPIHWDEERADAMNALNENARVPAVAMESALGAYAARFPTEEADWLHPSLMGTQALRDALNDAVSRGEALTPEEIDRRFGPLSWDW